MKSIFIKSSFSLLKDGIKNNVLQFFLDAIAITKQSVNETIGQNCHQTARFQKPYWPGPGLGVL